MPMPPSPLARLGAFRTELHACFLRRADALFELSDALLCAQTPLPSLPHLSLEPVHSPEGAINAHPAGWCRRQVLGAVAAFVTVMLPGVPAWAPDWAGAGGESGSDRNRPFGCRGADCSGGARAWEAGAGSASGPPVTGRLGRAFAAKCPRAAGTGLVTIAAGLIRSLSDLES